MSKLKELRIVDNFYQTSSFYPMPTTLISTVSENGQTNLGAYSLCFPYYVAGKDYYAMVLEYRNSSNTAQNILRTKRATINFVTDERKYFKEAVRLGFPGETTAEKMKDCIFTMSESNLVDDRPQYSACARLTNIPRVFLKAALTQMVKIAKEENISLIDEKALDIINDKRRKEKKN